jgi:glycosyltransferase involved in cell wall biosynthesis
VRRQLEVLSLMGHEVDLVCYPLGRDSPIPGVRVHRVWAWPGLSDVKIGPSFAKFPLGALLVWRALRMGLRRRYDLVQAVEEAAFAAAWMKGVFRCPLVYNMDSHISDHLHYSGFVRSPALRRLAAAAERAAMRRADCVVTVGGAFSDIVRSAAPRARVLQLEDAPLDETFEEDTDGAARLRAELGVGDAPVVLYTGNFIGYQGVELLVRGMGRVCSQMPAVRAVFAGGEQPEIEIMKRVAAEAGAADACVFAGKRPTAQMRAFTTMASVLVSPRAQGENPPLKIYPYMQSGRVTVATRMPSHTQVLDDGCAILVPVTPEGLAGGILRAFRDPAAAARLAAEAKRRAATLYSLDSFRAKARGMYEDLLAGRGERT